MWYSVGRALSKHACFPFIRISKCNFIELERAAVQNSFNSFLSILQLTFITIFSKKLQAYACVGNFADMVELKSRQCATPLRLKPVKHTHTHTHFALQYRVSVFSFCFAFGCFTFQFLLAQRIKCTDFIIASMPNETMWTEEI